jgi:hypothetical protein
MCLVQKRGGEERDFNEGEGMEGEGSEKGKFLIIYMFGSEEGRRGRGF